MHMGRLDEWLDLPGAGECFFLLGVVVAHIPRWNSREAATELHVGPTELRQDVPERERMEEGRERGERPGSENGTVSI